MSKFRLMAAAAIACMVTLISSGAAQAYSECGITLRLSDATVVGGNTFDFTADAGAVNCAWVVTYRGETKTGNGTSFSGSFDTPVVTKKTSSSIVAKCTWDDEDVASSASASDLAPAFYSTAPATNLQAVVRTCPVEATVTLLPKGGVADDGSALPDTGGSNLSLILLGGGLLLLGGGVTYMARRRTSSH